MSNSELELVARKLVARGKGILAADESFPTIEKRFKGVGVASTEENRHAYREMLFTTPALGEYISGVILFDETIGQRARNGQSLPKVLESQGIIPGIKVDKGTVAMPGFPGEKMTEGLDGLRDRLAQYRGLGARFAKWRAVLSIGPGMPSAQCVRANALSLALYAALSQEAGLVPVVEPEVLMDGPHDLGRCEEVTGCVLDSVFAALREHRVALEGALLKPNMVLPGKACPVQAPSQEVAAATLRCLRRTVPAALPGIVFLSGGQTPVQATENLNAMNAAGPGPWALSFSYGRALQEPALAAWRGSMANGPAAQKALHHRARCNGAARYGQYSPKLEAEGLA